MNIPKLIQNNDLLTSPFWQKSKPLKAAVGQLTSINFYSKIFVIKIGFLNQFRYRYFLFVFFTIFFQLKNLGAQVIDSSFFQWKIYELQDGEEDEKKCYMVTYPIKSDSDQPTRDKSYIMITRYQNRRSEEISISSGFEYKINSQALLAVDDARFYLATNNDMAWASNKNYDVAVIQQMLISASARVRSNSAVGTFAIDEYSLKGIAKAYSRLKTICN